jgi:porphobilinogen synthase
MASKISLPRVKLHASLRHPSCRSSFLEPKIHASQLVWPVFVTSRESDKEIGGCFKYPNIQWGAGKHKTYDTLLQQCVQLVEEHGMRHLMLFGVVDHKDSIGSLADLAGQSPILDCIKAIRAEPRLNRMSLFTDVCLCEYTDHGHCGIVHPETNTINNPASVERLAKVAVEYAKAGADVVCPSDMMDSRVGAIRDRLDESGCDHVMIMSYTSKKASVLYSPFRDAVESTFKGNRSTYQHPVGSAGIARRALTRDVAEGADMVLVKPSLMYTDIISDLKARCDLPVAAYLVSGEYKMLSEYGNDRIIREAHLSLVRAGANCLVTYFTPWILQNSLLDVWNE